jgi:hypothetical protein
MIRLIGSPPTGVGYCKPATGVSDLMLSRVLYVRSYYSGLARPEYRPLIDRLDRLATYAARRLSRG